VLTTEWCCTYYYVDNFFFREQRNEILDAGGDAASSEKKKSFEDIGRVIGQRWREILPDELAKYQDLAKKDAERYRNEMKVFYEEELALMCSGHASVAASLDDDRKPSANAQKPTRDTQTVQNSQQQQQQQQPQTFGRERFTVASPSAALSTPVSASSLAMDTKKNTDVIGAEQLLKLQSMLQHQENNAFSARELNKESLTNEINAQRLAIQQRLVTLLQESEMLRAKDRLLEQLFANLSGASGSSLNSTDARASVAAPAGAGFQPCISSDLQATFPHNAHRAPTVRAGNFGVTEPASRMAPSLGQLFNQPQQALTTDNAFLITQLMASRGQLHQQFAASSGAPPAASSSTNQSSTTAGDCTNLSLFANNITSSLQNGPMHDLQTLIARSATGSTSQSQISGLFGLAGSFFLGNPNNSSQPPPEIASLIAQIIASQQNEERSSGYTGDGERN
jgi:hypothetical protein